MKKIFLLLFIIIAILLSANDKTLEERINLYSGDNAADLLNLLNSSSNTALPYLEFILENSSPYDLATLTSEYLEYNLKAIEKAKSLPYTKDIPEEIFLHFVLPLRISQEPFENWRLDFYEQILPSVENCETIEAAVQEVNWWVNERIKFTQTNGRDQGPLTSLRRGYGRCEEIMILLIAALRSVGIPARPVSAPYWNHMDNNHAWEEVWTPEGWKFMAGWGATNIREATWYSQRAATTTLVTSHAFGVYESPEAIRYEDNTTLLSAVATYTDPIISTISIKHEDNTPVEDAYVMLYGISYGGLFPMMRLNSDASGNIMIPMGRGGCFISAGKDSLIGYNYLNLNNGNNCTLILKEKRDLAFDFQIQFPPPVKKPFDWIEPIRTNEHKLRSEIARLRFDHKWNNRLQQQRFLDFYDKILTINNKDEEYLKNRENFLQKTEKLAGSTEDYLKVINKIAQDEERASILIMMLSDWDIKELVELPDSTSIYQTVDIFFQNKDNFSIQDSLWRTNILNQTFNRVPSPENGWRQTFYQKIKHLKSSDEISTFNHIGEWLDSQIIIDSTLTWTYFTGVLDPNQMLNMKHLSQSERLYLLNDALVLLGIPTKWTGFLSYYDGDKFQPVETSEKKEIQHSTIEKEISIYLDSQQIQATPWVNFLLAKQNDYGVLRYIFMEDSADSLNCKVTYFTDPDDHIVLESFIRNSNGDAHIKVQSLENISSSEIINLTTPTEFFNNMRQWDDEIVAKIKALQQNDQPTLIFVNNNQDLEPQQRMLAQLRQKKTNFADKNCEIIIYSENRNLKDEDFKIVKGKQISALDQEEYPLIFLLNAQGKIIYSVNGYYMGIADLLLRQL